MPVLRRLFALFPFMLLLLAGPLSAPARAGSYDAELPAALLHGPDLCAHADCRAVLPRASRFTQRKGSPQYVEGYARAADGSEQLAGYVFLSTDVVDIPAYSGKPVVTLVGMDRSGVIAGVRVLKHSEPILLAGIPESALQRFIAQYPGRRADARFEIGGASGLDAISGATVTAIAENQVIARSAYEIGRQVGIFTTAARPPARFTALDERLDWAALAKEGSIARLRVSEAEAGALASGQPYVDLQFGYLNAASVGNSVLGEEGYRQLIAGLAQDEHAIFIVAHGSGSFKGSGFVRGGIYDRVQLRQDSRTYTFRDTDYLNLYSVRAAGAPAYRESAIFIVRSADFNPAWPWSLSLLAHGASAGGKAGGKVDFKRFEQEYWLPARYLEGGHPLVVEAQPAWRAIWAARVPQLAAFCALLAFTALLYSQRDRLVRASTRQHKPWISVPRLALWLASAGFFGLYLKAQPSITQVLTWVHSILYQWKWELFLSDPFIFLFWCFIAVTVLVWGRGLFCGWLCPFGSLQHLALKLGKLVGLGRYQKLLPKRLHDRLKWLKYGVFFTLLAVSLWSMENAELLAEVEPFKTTFLVGIWQRSWPYGLFVGAILGLAMFSERPYCKYLCPLGAGLALPGRFRLLGLKRKAECTSCKACAAGCGSHAIDAQGRIDQTECMLCLDCMVMYYDDHACPPLVRERKQREKAGLALSRIDAGGHFIPLDSLRASLPARRSEP
ncbi:4Fe-4S binding protein [Massilia sp. FT127W]|uniref:4Fe-4S binding protein n=1 Tax=Pseudoduganella aquatica TaxID=2660641 RepID=A0A7X4HFD2_9BURK|nr:4Fe-4S binding protein [Pseudoduganella aquatica]